MRKTLRKALVASAVVATGIGLAAVPASAAPPWTVSGAPTPPDTVIGESSNTNLQLFRGAGTTPVAILRCELVTVDAEINNGVYNSAPATIGSIVGSTWTTCRDDSFGLTFTVSPDHTPAWPLVITADGPGAGQHKGVVQNAAASISGPGCTASFAGNAPGHYDNSGVLTMDPADGTNTLTVTAASCLGIIQTGDRGEFRGAFTVDPVISITP